MKKSILKMMAEASPDNADKDGKEPPASPLARNRRGSSVVSNVGKVTIELFTSLPLAQLL